MTAVPKPSFNPNGFAAPLEQDILAGAIDDVDAAFGGGLNPSLTTPQGQLAQSAAAIIGNVNDAFLYYVSQTDPAYAQGRMQDAIGRIYFIERNPAQPTTVQCTCTGLPGVVIPKNAVAVDNSGNYYIATAGGTIGGDGSVSLAFENQVTGPIPCPAGALQQIYRSIPGWDTIYNPADGVLGNLVESRAEFEARRTLAVAGNSLGSIPSVLGAVLKIQNVVDAYVLDNSSAAPQTIGGVLLASNSLYVAAVGGDDTDVAQAIWRHKAPGCAYNGNTTVVVEDTSSGYSPPYPSYSVSFTRPANLQIVFAIQILNSAQVPFNYRELIQQAIADAFVGLDDGPRMRIGSKVLASRFYAPVAKLGPWAQILSIEIGSVNLTSAVFVGSIAGTTLTVTSVISGTLTIGQTLTDASGALLVGTKITSTGTGSGGAGTYIIDKTQTLGSETMKAIAPNLFEVSARIDQFPVVSAANIGVTLV